MSVGLFLVHTEYRVGFPRHLQDLGLEVQERFLISDVEPDGYGGAHFI